MLLKKSLALFGMVMLLANLGFSVVSVVYAGDTQTVSEVPSVSENPFDEDLLPEDPYDVLDRIENLKNGSFDVVFRPQVHIHELDIFSLWISAEDSQGSWSRLDNVKKVINGDQGHIVSVTFTPIIAQAEEQKIKIRVGYTNGYDPTREATLTIPADPEKKKEVKLAKLKILVDGQDLPATISFTEPQKKVNITMDFENVYPGLKFTSCTLKGTDGKSYNRHGEEVKGDSDQFAGCDGLFQGSAWAYAFPAQVYTLSVGFDENNKRDFTFTFERKVDISFESNKGSAVEKIEVASGFVVPMEKKPVDPKRSGYKFRGWYKEAGLINEFKFESDKVTGPTQLFAKWKKKTSSSSNSSSESSSNSSSESSSNSSSESSSNSSSGATVNTGASMTSATLVTGGVMTLEALRNERVEKLKADEVKLERLAKALDSAKNATETQELKDAYTYAYLRGISTQESIEKAGLHRALTRGELAKMMSVYAIEVMGKKVVKTEVPVYADAVKFEGDLSGYITLAYQLGIMGIDGEGKALVNFDANKEVTRAEFGTVLSRMMFGDKYNTVEVNWSEPHLNALKGAGIIKDTNAHMQEQRGRVMLILQRVEGVK